MSDGRIVLTLRNKVGLHARPAARFVQTAARFQAEIRVRNLTRGTAPVNAKAILSVLTLGAEQGHQIEVEATGPDADAALKALEALVEALADEDEGP